MEKKDKQTRLQVLINEYICIAKKSQNIELILKIQDEISALTYSMAEQLGNFYMEYVDVEIDRKRLFNELTLKYSKEESMAKSEVKANNELSEIIESEKKMEAKYQALKLKLHQANKVVDAIRQQVAYLRGEKEMNNFVSNGSK